MDGALVMILCFLVLCGSGFLFGCLACTTPPKVRTKVTKDMLTIMLIVDNVASCKEAKVIWVGNSPYISKHCWDHVYPYHIEDCGGGNVLMALGPNGTLPGSTNFRWVPGATVDRPKHTNYGANDGTA